MGVPRFYAGQIGAGRIRLDEQESRHARAARRLSVDDAVAVFDGQGGEGLGRIAALGRQAVEIEVLEIRNQPRPRPQLTLAVALPKGPRQDTLIEKCTELGVTRLIPLITQRSISGASDHRREKWQRTAIEAAKQSAQAWIPEFSEPSPLAAVLETFGQYDQVAVAAIGAERSILPAAGRILALIGPEGDWTPDELAMLTQRGAIPFTLGPHTLRVETAAIAVAAILHAASIGSSA